MFGHLFHSFVLAQIFGLYLIIMSVIMLSRVRLFRRLISQMQVESSGLIMGASFGLLLGISMVVVHNIWVWEPRVMVTLLAWFILLKSVLWLSLPDCMLRCAQKVYAGPGYYLVAIVMAVIGVFLMTKGFYHWMWIPDILAPG